jgi:hypothetical protein
VGAFSQKELELLQSFELHELRTPADIRETRAYLDGHQLPVTAGDALTKR